MLYCDLCKKEFKFQSKLDIHKNSKKICTSGKKKYSCDICKIDCERPAELERHLNTKRCKDKHNNNTHIGDNITIENQNITYQLNSFSETNLDVLSQSNIEYILTSENNLIKMIDDFEKDEENIFGSSDYIIISFNFFIKLFSKLNFNLAYTENHNFAIFSFFKTFINYTEYQLLEIDNINKQYEVKCIGYELFIDEFINLMMKINNKFNNEKFKIALDYIKRYKKIVFSDVCKKIIEKKLLDSYNEFKEIKNNKKIEDELFNKTLLESRNNAFC
jgi:hypothetical protein